MTASGEEAIPAVAAKDDMFWLGDAERDITLFAEEGLRHNGGDSLPGWNFSRLDTARPLVTRLKDF